MQSKKIAFAAVMTAISWILIAFTRILPIGTISLFVLCELAVFCVFLNSGSLAGILVCLANILLSFLVLPAGWLFILLFAPHSIVNGLFSRLVALKQGLTKKRKYLYTLLRCLVVLIVFNLSFFLVFRLTGLMFFANAFTELIESYFLLALVLSLAFLVYDILFLSTEKHILRLLKLIYKN